MKTPHQPGDDEISWFDERRGDKGGGGGEQPNEQETNPSVWGGR